MKILITGSEGFIGRHLATELRGVGHSVKGVDIKDAGGRVNITDPRQVFLHVDQFKPSVIVHLAEIDHHEVMQTIRENVGGSAVVAKLAGELGIRMVIGSSGSIYPPSPKALEYQTAHAPKDIFSLTKLWAEQVAEAYAPRGFTSLRFQNVYGPDLNPERLPILGVMWSAYKGQPVLTPDTAYQWCWIGDAVRAARMVIDSGEGLYNIAGSEELEHMYNVAKMACHAADADPSLIEVMRSTTPTTLLSTNRLRRLGWKPEFSLEEGIEKTIETWRMSEAEVVTA